jgi:hypothetical protein
MLLRHLPHQPVRHISSNWKKSQLLLRLGLGLTAKSC